MFRLKISPSSAIASASATNGNPFRLFSPKNLHLKQQSALPSSISNLNGFIAINKPEKFTSNDVVQKVKWNIICSLFPDDKQQKRKCHSLLKVGHGGTLDPNATGVLILGFGDACKQFERYLKGNKEYHSTGRLGIGTDTDDIWGKEIAQKPWNHIGESMLREAASKFTGMIMQRPPNYSAISIDGKRMYDLALKGKKMPEIPERPVTIYKLEMLKVDLPNFEFKMLCSGGTYVRSFVRDLGSTLGTVATMTSLVRTIQGEFSLEDCMTIEQTNDIELLREKLSQSRRKFIYGK